jgi:methylmalonyl-CoA mutase C-terminal domain/subunit
MALFPRVRAALEKRGLGNVLLTGGGIIPQDDMKALEASGYTKLFGPGTPTEEIAKWITAQMEARWQKEGAAQ